MIFRPVPLACAAAAALFVSGCGGGSNQDGQTFATGGAVAGAYALACVDTNHNWQCDDGDVARKVAGSGDSGLAPAADQYVLLETRDANNQRTALLISERGKGSVDGLTTLRTMLALGTGSSLEQSLAARSGAQLAATLETGFAATFAAHPVGLSALAAYAGQVRAQGTAGSTAAGVTTTLGAATTAASWSVPGSDDGNRQLSALASTVLGTNESNRLFLFDPTASVVATREVDLLPAAEVTTARVRRPSNVWLAALDRVVSLVVDTASAASSVVGTPTAPVTIPPGKGIAGAILTHSGAEAYALMNLGSGRYTDATCAARGSEGIFKVGLAASDPASFRQLGQSPACVHSGFTLLASDPTGARIAAWDGTAHQFWTVDGATMKEKSVIALSASFTPTTVAVSPGGHYAALVGSDTVNGGQAVLIDLDAGRVLTTLTGAWAAATQVAFADGVRTLLIASGPTIASVALDNALQPIATTLTANGEDVKGLAVTPDGSGYVAVGATTVNWRAVRGAT